MASTVIQSSPIRINKNELFLTSTLTIFVLFPTVTSTVVEPLLIPVITPLLSTVAISGFWLLKEISSYRKMGIGLSDIKEILNDKSVLKQILIEKKKEITISQNELEALEKFIENNNIEELYDSVDYKTLADAIQNSIPGFYGYYFLNHFLPYLQIRIQTKEQQEAYNRLIEFWDNINIRIPFLMKLNSWILFKLNSKKSLIVQIEQIDS